MKIFTVQQFGRSWVEGLVGMVVLAITSPALAASLFGVTGNGAPIPETFYSVSIVDASTTFIQTLGNGGGGESIAFRPADGLMYHWSGNRTTKIMETINLNTTAVTNIPTNFGPFEPREVRGSTYDPGLDRFLFTDFDSSTLTLGAVTPGGDVLLTWDYPKRYRNEGSGVQRRQLVCR